MSLPCSNVQPHAIMLPRSEKVYGLIEINNHSLQNLNKKTCNLSQTLEHLNESFSGDPHDSEEASVFGYY